MSDGVVANPGVGGATFATDDDGTYQWPYAKVAFGADNTQTPVSTGAAALPIQDGGNSITVDGTFFQATQPVSLTSTTITGTVAATQSGTWNITNVSGTISLPTGASTAAKQPALGTAGSAATDVITVQGIAAMTPLLVTATISSGTTTVTQATGTNLHMVVDSGTVTTVSTVTAVTTVSTLTSLTQFGGTNIVTAGVAGMLAVGGNTATNVALTANPINNGAQAVSAENAAVTATRGVQLVADLVGKLIVLPYANPENFVSGTITSAMTGTTSTSLMAAPASGLRNYITQITVSNGSTTVPTDIVIQDGNGGTTLYVLPAPIGTGTGTGTSGGTFTFPTPLRQPTTATAIYCANVTTGSSTKVSASGYKGA